MVVRRSVEGIVPSTRGIESVAILCEVAATVGKFAALAVNENFPPRPGGVKTAGAFFGLLNIAESDINYNRATEGSAKK